MSNEQTTAIQKVSPLNGLAARFSIEPAKLLEVLRGTVIKPSSSGHTATNEEVAAFCIVAAQYDLNPFLREIHAFASGEKGIVPIVGIDGWCHIVNGSDGFDGCEFEEIADKEGKPVSITCKMYVKGRQHPVCATERFAECKRNTAPWNTMPWRMLRHKSYIQAARYAFGLAGIYDEDEARDIIHNAGERPPIAMPKAISVPAAVTETTPAAPTPVNAGQDDDSIPMGEQPPAPEKPQEQPPTTNPTPPEQPPAKPEPEGMVTKTVDTVSEFREAKNGGRYRTVRFDDGIKVNVFDDKFAIVPGKQVKVLLETNGKYTNLKSWTHCPF